MVYLFVCVYLFLKLIVSTPHFDAQIMDSWLKSTNFSGIMDDPVDEDGMTQDEAPLQASIAWS